MSRNCVFVPAEVDATPTTASPSNVKIESVNFYLYWSELQKLQGCLKNLQMVNFQNNSPNSLPLQTTLQAAFSINECLLNYFEQVADKNSFSMAIFVNYPPLMLLISQKNQRELFNMMRIRIKMAIFRRTKN